MFSHTVHFLNKMLVEIFSPFISDILDDMLLEYALFVQSSSAFQIYNSGW